MEQILQEIPLVIFTVFAQFAVGSILGMIILSCSTLSKEQYEKLHQIMFFPLVLLAIGFMVSITHLGSPFRAFNALNQIGLSGLSNEIVAGSVFFVIAGLYWLLGLFKCLSNSTQTIVKGIVILVGLAFMYFMGILYQIPTVITWYQGYTLPTFWLTAVLGGCAVNSFMSQKLMLPYRTRKFVLVLGLISTLLVLLIILLQSQSWASIHISGISALSLVPDFLVWVVVRCVLLMATIGAWIVTLLRVQSNLWIGLGIVIATLIAEILGRIVFYGMHMTVGV